MDFGKVKRRRIDKIIFVYLMFFLPSEYLCTPSVEENIIQLPFSTATILPKNKFFDKLKASHTGGFLTVDKVAET